MPILGVPYADKFRQLKVDEAVYETLTKQFELAKVQEAKEIPSVKVLDTPEIPEHKSFPPRTLIVLGGTCLAFALSVLWILGEQRWRRIDPGDPLDKNLYELPPDELANVPSVPDSLSGAIKALSDDHGFLLKGDVFNADFVANWIEMKQKEYDALRLRPHPYEFAMYYDV